MPAAKNVQPMSVEEYLALEEKSQIKHEYVDGFIFAMTGASARHNVVSGNIFAVLHAHVRGSRCRAFMADMKARVEISNCFYYPDVMVACGKHDDAAVVAPDPVLIVEVLSPSTTSVDRREKMLAYRQVPSLQEYMIVHQRGPRVELHRRISDDKWESLEFLPGSPVGLTSIPCGSLTLSFDTIYEGVQWEQTKGYIREDEAEWDTEDLDY